MKKRTTYACLLSFLILFSCIAPSFAISINKVYGQLMLKYSENARLAAGSVSGNDLGLDLDSDQEMIYKLGYARGYDDAAESLPSSASSSITDKAREAIAAATDSSKKNSSSSITTGSTTTPSTSTMVWIPTKGGKKYHKKSSCSGMVDPRNVTKEEAIRLGFDPCGRCY